MRPIRILAALAIAALVACDTSPAPQHGFGGFTGGGFTPPGGGISWGSGGFAGGGGFVPFPWFYLDASIDAPSGTTMSVAITDSADPVITGADAYSYSVVLTNTGAVNATTVSVATTLDASLTYVSSSGTGWSCGQAAGVVTCTAASIAVGAAPAITINVTTGTSAVSASSSVVATASNASNATASQGTTVQLVSKDALAGIYVPATSTEWTNFIARKGLGISAPSVLWLCQEASGNLADSIGAFPATASGTGLGYQAAVTGWSRKAVTTTDGSTGHFFSTSTSLPDGSVASVTTLAYVNVTSATTATRTILRNVNTTAMEAEVTTTPRAKVTVGGASATGSTNNPTTAGVMPWVIKHNFTSSAQAFYDLQEKLVPTFTALSGKLISIGSGAGNSATAQYLYVAVFFNSGAELSDAQVKALLQALGWSVPWS